MSQQVATDQVEAGGARRSGKRRRRLVREGWVIAVAFSLALAAGHLWPHDYSRTGRIHVALSWVSFVIMTLRYHLGLLLVLVALGAALGQRWKLAGLAGVVGLWAVWPTWALLLPRQGPRPAGPTFRVMSMNLLSINRHTDAIAGEIHRADPDLLLLQEYTAHWHEALVAEFADRYPHRHVRAREDSFGAAVYAKLPFAEPATLATPIGEVPQIRAVVRWAGRRLAVYNLHLLPPHSFSYLPARRRQILDLTRRLGEEPLPMVVAGDLNFTANSPGAFAFEQVGLSDVHQLAGWGHGHTWPVHGMFRYLPLPGFRIDHVFIGPGLRAVSCRTGRGSGSDHRPLICDLAWAE